MDDLGSGVVGAAHEVGTWRGPASRPWLRRIVNGAGFTSAWDESRLLTGDPVEPPPAAPPTAPEALPPDDRAVDPFRMWWLPTAHER
jgi:hypothetical protein